MAVDITLSDLANLDNGPSATATINANNAAITSAFEKVLNTQALNPGSVLTNNMAAALDMNGQQILNLPAPATINSPVRLADVTSDLSPIVPPTGTSGAVVPFLNGANTWTGSDDFTSAVINVHTQTAADNSTKAASTAYVDAAVSGGVGSTLPGLSVSGRAGTTTGVAAAITGTASQFLGINGGGTSLAFETMGGDATLAGPNITLATVNSGPGTTGSSTVIPTITTNGKGLITSQSANAVIAPAGTLSGTALASNVVTSTLGATAKDLELGADLASPTTSSLQAQSTLTGTNNQAGSDFTISGSKGTGTGVGGSVLINTSPAGGSGTAQNAGVQRVKVDSKGNVVHGNAAIATNATDGFTYIATCAGTPTGIPTTYTGTVPLVYDTTNHKFYIYDGAWKGGTAPGVWS